MNDEEMNCDSFPYDADYLGKVEGGHLLTNLWTILVRG